MPGIMPSPCPHDAYFPEYFDTEIRLYEQEVEKSKGMLTKNLSRLGRKGEPTEEAGRTLSRPFQITLQITVSPAQLTTCRVSLKQNPSPFP